jgi:glucose-1-phosphate adenylyltransferase
MLLILSGDQLYQMDFNDMLEEHIKKKLIFLLQPTRKCKDAPEFGILKQT